MHSTNVYDLENALIPYRVEEKRELLLGEGFQSREEFFRL